MGHPQDRYWPENGANCTGRSPGDLARGSLPGPQDWIPDHRLITLCHLWETSAINYTHTPWTSSGFDFSRFHFWQVVKLYPLHTYTKKGYILVTTTALDSHLIFASDRLQFNGSEAKVRKGLLVHTFVAARHIHKILILSKSKQRILYKADCMQVHMFVKWKV